MYNPVLTGKLRELKESQEGVRMMCAELIQLREEGRAEGREEGKRQRALAIAGSLLKAGMDHSLVAEHTGLPLEEIDRLSA